MGVESPDLVEALDRAVVVGSVVIVRAQVVSGPCHREAACRLPKLARGQNPASRVGPIIDRARTGDGHCAFTRIGERCRRGWVSASHVNRRHTGLTQPRRINADRVLAGHKVVRLPSIARLTHRLTPWGPQPSKRVPLSPLRCAGEPCRTREESRPGSHFPRFRRVTSSPPASLCGAKNLDDMLIHDLRRTTAVKSSACSVPSENSSTSW